MSNLSQPGKVIKKTPLEFIGEKQYKKQLIIVKSYHSDSIYAFEAFGSKADKLADIEEDQDVNVTYTIKCNEWNGKYFVKLQLEDIFVGNTKPESKGPKPSAKKTSKEIMKDANQQTDFELLLGDLPVSKKYTEKDFDTGTPRVNYASGTDDDMPF